VGLGATVEISIFLLHIRPCYTNEVVAVIPASAKSYCNFNKKVDGNHMQVSVRDNNVDQALRVLKKKLQKEGVFREMKLKQHFEKPSEKNARQKAEAIRRARKLARKKLEREG
jgi:small subunit ribosomal protein S21|tara:strand:+ start:939 stop:1277 length:339 start_codon:yes stop_codon:yes gene_type:complete